MNLSYIIVNQSAELNYYNAASQRGVKSLYALIQFYEKQFNQSSDQLTNYEQQAAQRNLTIAKCIELHQEMSDHGNSTYNDFLVAPIEKYSSKRLDSYTELLNEIENVNVFDIVNAIVKCKGVGTCLKDVLGQIDDKLVDVKYANIRALKTFKDSLEEEYQEQGATILDLQMIYLDQLVDLYDEVINCLRDAGMIIN